MTEEINKHPWYAIFFVGVFAGAVFSILVFSGLDSKMHNAKEKISKQHIDTVTMIDKNCNDCHLGASFVNLFNHPTVKSNDNVVRFMMDRAKIKQW